MGRPPDSGIPARDRLWNENCSDSLRGHCCVVVLYCTVPIIGLYNSLCLVAHKVWAIKVVAIAWKKSKYSVVITYILPIRSAAVTAVQYSTVQ